MKPHKDRLVIAGALIAAQIDIYICSDKPHDSEPYPVQLIDQVAGQLYDNYCIAVGGKAFNGEPLPKWSEFGTDPTKQTQANGWRKIAEDSLMSKINGLAPEPVY